MRKKTTIVDAESDLTAAIREAQKLKAHIMAARKEFAKECKEQRDIFNLDLKEYRKERWDIIQTVFRDAEKMAKKEKDEMYQAYQYAKQALLQPGNLDQRLTRVEYWVDHERGFGRGRPAPRPDLPYSVQDGGIYWALI